MYTTTVASPNTNSEVLLDAMPALARAVRKDDSHKLTLFLLINHWLTSYQQRIEPSHLPCPKKEDVSAFLSLARKHSETPVEDGAIETIIARDPEVFNAVEWVLGFD